MHWLGGLDQCSSFVILVTIQTLISISMTVDYDAADAMIELQNSFHQFAGRDGGAAAGSDLVTCLLQKENSLMRGAGVDSNAAACVVSAAANPPSSPAGSSLPRSAVLCSRPTRSQVTVAVSTALHAWQDSATINLRVSR